MTISREFEKKNYEHRNVRVRKFKTNQISLLTDGIRQACWVKDQPCPISSDSKTEFTIHPKQWENLSQGTGILSLFFQRCPSVQIWFSQLRFNSRGKYWLSLRILHPRKVTSIIFLLSSTFVLGIVHYWRAVSIITAEHEYAARSRNSTRIPPT